nr:unnamed protein product [Digitaria exilis]
MKSRRWGRREHLSSAAGRRSLVTGNFAFSVAASRCCLGARFRSVLCSGRRVGPGRGGGVAWHGVGRVGQAGVAQEGKGGQRKG